MIVLCASLYAVRPVHHQLWQIGDRVAQTVFTFDAPRQFLCPVIRRRREVGDGKPVWFPAANAVVGRRRLGLALPVRLKHFRRFERVDVVPIHTSEWHCESGTL